MSEKLWENVFGFVWKPLTEAYGDIGGFIIDHNNKTVYTDEIFRKMIGIGGEPDYNEMVALAADLVEQTEYGFSLNARVFRYNDNITAGFVREMGSMHNDSKVLPVCDVSQIRHTLTEKPNSSTIALLRFEDKDGKCPTDYVIFNALTSIIKSTPKGSLVSSLSKDKFWLLISEKTEGDKKSYFEKLRTEVRGSIDKQIYGEELFASDSVTFSVGIGVDDAEAEERMNTAEFSLYKASQSGKGSVYMFSDSDYSDMSSELSLTRKFNRLVDENLFIYNFQPIVSAHTGEIVAYEALMRSEPDIGMFPLEILDIAEKQERLYDIERATLFNTLKAVEEHQEVFVNKKLFVNSITAHMLTDDDWALFEQQYGELLEKMVMELTEQTEVDDDALMIIKNRLKQNNISLAVDDYGTGYSNTSNLVRYSPDFVKIDRALIEGIDKKPKMQKLVVGIIEFLHINGYSALAEGVETYEELRTMIKLGSDLIQGYYVSRPKPFFLYEIGENIREDITKINLEFSDEIERVYHPVNGEIVSMKFLSENRYTSVFVEVDSLTIVGDTGFSDPIICTVNIKDKTKSRVVLDNVSITAEKENATILLGDESELELVIVGENVLRARGIYVHESAKLRLTGEGSLSVSSEIVGAFGIGASKDQSHGSIETDVALLDIEVDGDTAIALGGGKNDRGNTISLNGGEVRLRCSGGSCIGIGTLSGNSVVDLNSVGCSVTINAGNCIAVGSLEGSTNIQLDHFKLTTSLSGLNLCGVGVMNGGTGRIRFADGEICGDMHGRAIRCIGTHKGNIDIDARTSRVDYYCEGSSTTFIGDYSGNGNVFIKESGLFAKAYTKDGYGVVSKTGEVKLSDCYEKVEMTE